MREIYPMLSFDIITSNTQPILLQRKRKASISSYCSHIMVISNKLTMQYTNHSPVLDLPDQIWYAIISIILQFRSGQEQTKIERDVTLGTVCTLTLLEYTLLRYTRRLEVFRKKFLTRSRCFPKFVAGRWATMQETKRVSLVLCRHKDWRKFLCARYFRLGAKSFRKTVWLATC